MTTPQAHVTMLANGVRVVALALLAPDRVAPQRDACAQQRLFPIPEGQLAQGFFNNNPQTIAPFLRM